MNDVLDTFPVRKCDFEKKNGLITVFYKEERPNILEKIFSSNWSGKPQKIDLDKIGSFIWELCDGTRSVSDIIEIAKSEFDNEIEPAKERITLFINQLANTNLIQLYIKTKSE